WATRSRDAARACGVRSASVSSVLSRRKARSPAESASEVDSLASRRMSRSASTDRGLPRLSKALSRRVVYSCAGLLMHTMLRRNPPLLKGSRHRGSRHGGRGSAALEADPLDRKSTRPFRGHSYVRHGNLFSQEPLVSPVGP